MKWSLQSLYYYQGSCRHMKFISFQESVNIQHFRPILEILLYHYIASVTVKVKAVRF